MESDSKRFFLLMNRWQQETIRDKNSITHKSEE